MSAVTVYSMIHGQGGTPTLDDARNITTPTAVAPLLLYQARQQSEEDGDLCCCYTGGYPSLDACPCSILCSFHGHGRKAANSHDEGGVFASVSPDEKGINVPLSVV